MAQEHTGNGQHEDTKEGNDTGGFKISGFSLKTTKKREVPGFQRETAKDERDFVTGISDNKIERYISIIIIS
jgi:hypothetical protein